MTMKRGRLMLPGPTDGAAERRVPTERLHLIPDSARKSFVPWMPALPGLKVGENDLTRIAPGRPQAEGNVIEVSGQVLNEFGRPLRRTLVEIWNANKWGRYAHIHDLGLTPLDPNFLGVGRTMTDGEGRYHFRTIYPGSYLARPDIDRWRPSHIHISLRGGSSRLIAQMYFKGDPNLARDPMFHLLGEAQPRHFGRVVGHGPSGETQYHWDIVIGGRNAHFFEH